MRDNEKNKSQLIKELSALRKQVREFGDLQVERNQVQEKLRESEEKYRLLFAAEQDAIVIVDIESQRIVDANGAAWTIHHKTDFPLSLMNFKKMKRSLEP